MNLPSAFQKVNVLGSHLRIHYSVLFSGPNKYTGKKKLSVSNGLDDIQSSHSFSYFLSIPKSQDTLDISFLSFLENILCPCLLSK